MTFAIIFLSQGNSTLSGSLKILQGTGWFCMRFHFFIKASFIINTKGLYCFTKGNISFSSLLFCFGSAAFLSVSFTSNSNFPFKIMWLASVHQALFEICNTSSEEFVRRIFKASHLSNLFQQLVGDKRWKRIYWKVSVKNGLYVKDSFFSFFVECCVVPWYSTVSKKIVSLSDILAVSFIVWWCNPKG